MPELRGFSGQAVVGILQRMGFDLRRSKGSHVVLRRDGAVCVVQDIPIQINSCPSAQKAGASPGVSSGGLMD